MASKGAFDAVFPEAVVKGCLFHYSQAVQRKVGQNGLELVYRQQPPFDGPEFTEVRRWIRRLIALAVSPVRFHRVVWNYWLHTPPRTGDQVVDANLLNFRNYFATQWLSNREKALLWNHFDRTGPRTTNHAEGYHNGLRSVFETRRQPPLGVFMGKMREVHHEIRSRVKQLERGAEPNPRRATYIQNDLNLEAAKQSLLHWLQQNIPAGVHIAQYTAQTTHNLCARLLRHLDRVQHLIG